MRRKPTVFRTLDLPGGTLLPFATNPRERVRVMCGRVWLTEEGSLRDSFLATGEELAFETRGLAVIETLSPARIQLIQSAGMSDPLRGLARRWMRWLTALWLRQYRRPLAARATCF